MNHTTFTAPKTMKTPIRLLSLLFALAVLMPLAALAYPPAPGVQVYGIVRGTDGFPIVDPEAKILFQSGERLLTSTSINPAGLTSSLSNNYQTLLPVDMNPARGSYRDDVVGEQLPFTALVKIGDQLYVPIESSVGLDAPGEAASSVRLDFTLGLDTDGDGIPDDWEYWLLQNAGIEPGSADWNLDQFSRDGDADGDGVTDYDEYVNGTYAINPVVPPDPVDNFDLKLTHTVDAATAPPFHPGDPVLFNYQIANQGNVTAQNIVVRQVLPAGALIGDSNWTQDGSFATRTVAGPVAPGDAAFISFSLILDDQATGSVSVASEIASAENIAGDSQTIPAGTEPPLEIVVEAEPDPTDPIDPVDPLDPNANFDVRFTQTLGDLTPGPFQPGDPISFSYELSNVGNVTAQNITVSQNIPPGFVLFDSSWTQAGSFATRSFAGPLDPGASGELSIGFYLEQAATGSVALVSEITGAENTYGTAQTITNPTDPNPLVITVDSPVDPTDPTDPTDPVDPMDPNDIFDLRLNQTLGVLTPGPFHPGDPIAFTYEISNGGNVTAQNIIVSQTIPPGFVLIGAGWTQSGSTATRTFAGPLAPGASAELGIAFILDQVPLGSVTLASTITGGENTYGTAQTISDPTDPTPLVVSVTAPVDPTDPVDPLDPNANFDVALVQTLGVLTPGPFEPSDPISFRYQIFNQGNVMAQNIVVSQTIPPGFVLFDDTWTQSGSIATRTLAGPLDPGASGELSIAFLLDQASTGSVALVSEITSGENSYGTAQTITNPSDPNPLVVVVQAPVDPTDPTDPPDPVDPLDPNAMYDLRLAQTLNALTPRPFESGQAISFDYEISNLGNVTAQNMVVSQTIPPGFMLFDGSWTESGNTATRTLAGPLSPGDSADFSIRFILSQSVTGAVSLVSEITRGENTYGTAQTIPNPSDPSPLSVVINSPADPTNPSEPDPVPSISLVKAQLGSITADNTGRYTVTFDYTFANNGEVALTDLSLTENFLATLADPSGTGMIIGGSLAGNASWAGSATENMLANGQQLAVGAEASLRVRFRFTPSAPGVVNTESAITASAAVGSASANATHGLPVDIPFADLGGLVWQDINLDNLQQSDEPGRAAVAVELIGIEGQVLATTRTDADGRYRFDRVPPVLASVHLPASNFQPGNVLADTRATSRPGDSLAVDGLSLGPVRLRLDGSGASVDVSLWTLPEIGGVVWDDMNTDGDPDEFLELFGLGGVEVRLFEIDASGQESLFDTLLTSAGKTELGAYRFGALEPGSYRVEVDLGNVPVILETPTTSLEYFVDLEPNQVAERNFGFVRTPTAIELERFAAHVTDTGVRIDWTTGWEEDVLGFNVHQVAADGSLHQVNAALIIGGDGEYSIAEDGVLGGRYVLEEVGTDLQRTLLEPMAFAQVPAPAQGVPTRELLAEEGALSFATSDDYRSYLVIGLGPNPKVLDLTDLDRPRQLNGEILGQETPAAYFSAPSGLQLRVE